MTGLTVRQFKGDATTTLIEQVLRPPGAEVTISDENVGSSYVCVGDTIFTEDEEGFLRGHGTQVINGKLVATVCGMVERVNKLVYVKTLNSRYTAEQGDVVVGRVYEIAGKAWRIDLKARQEAKLLLSAVHLPGGVQRRRNAEDELNMRSFFREGDLVSAEVQSLHGDGSIALHTRSAKYGKLQQGQLLVVPANLVKRQKQHYHTLEALGVIVIIGVNGLIWVAPHHPRPATDGQPGGLNGAPNSMETDSTTEEAAAAQQLPTPAQVQNVCRLANAVRALAKLYMPIFMPSVMGVYESAVEGGVLLADMVQPSFLELLVQQEARKRETAMQE